MKFSSIDIEHIQGIRFDNSYRLDLAENALYNREDALKNIMKGSNIIHIGCCDHVDLINDKISKGK